MGKSGGDSTKRLRQAFGTFATGVTVVTTFDDSNQPRGFTANSFTSVSLEPPLLLVCLSKAAATCPVFSLTTLFCVNVLAEDQQEISLRFASPGRDRFDGAAWHGGEAGCPVIDDVLSWFECELRQVVDAGDHVILLGQIVNYDFNSRSPLVYCAGSYVEFGLLQQAMEAASSGISTRIAAVVNCDGLIPMVRDPASRKLSLPCAARVGEAHETESLIGRLAGNGIRVTTPFVYAVYEDSRVKTHNVVYRGNADEPNAEMIREFEMISLEQVPWEDLADDALRMLLERYKEERERDQFGVYVGDNERGEVRTLSAGS